MGAALWGAPIDPTDATNWRPVARCSLAAALGATGKNNDGHQWTSADVERPLTYANAHHRTSPDEPWSIS